MSLKNRLLMVSIAGLMLLTITSWVGQLFVQKNNDQQLEYTSINYSTALWKVASEAASSLMANESKFLTRSRDTIKALKKGDKDALFEAAMPTFRRLSAGHAIDGLIISDLDGNILLNTANSRASGTLNTFISHIASEEKIRADLVLIDEQNSALIYGFPLYSRGKAKGIGAFFVGLDKVANNMSKNNDMIASLINIEGNLVFSSDEGISATLNPKKLDLGQPNTTILTIGDTTLSTTILPLVNGEGAKIASLVLQYDATQTARALAHLTIVKIVCSVLVLVLLSCAIFWQIHAGFRPLNTAVDAMREIASGDLSRTTVCKSCSEIAVMLEGVFEMRAKLRDIIEALIRNTTSLHNVASRASNIAQSASSGASRQQVETQSVATAITEISNTVQQVATDANKAAVSGDDANRQARDGQQAVDKVRHAIETLAKNVHSGTEAVMLVHQESDSIGKILGVIRGIAEQTNLLALNAAIEAARAGEQGRGFAVVADEVRTLATRTQQSTNEIQTMIERLQSGTEQAVDVMQNSQVQAKSSVEEALVASDVLIAITKAVDHISKMNASIASVAEEQSAVMEEINLSVVNISTIAEETASGAYNSTQSNAEIADLANALKSMTSQFTL